MEASRGMSTSEIEMQTAPAAAGGCAPPPLPERPTDADAKIRHRAPSRLADRPLRAPTPLFRRMARPTAFEAAANANDDILVPPPTGLARFKEALVSCFWELEEHLADLFGLNDSKYQWAVDRYMEEKAEEEDRRNFEAYETERAIEEENAKLAEDAEKLEGGEAEAATVGLTSQAGESSSRR